MFDRDDFPRLRLTPMEKAAQAIVITFVAAFGVLILSGLALIVAALAQAVFA